MEEEPVEHYPERPLECGQCKKSISIHYTEIVSKMITHTNMCADCPELQRRLHGSGSSGVGFSRLENVAGLCCGSCGTTLEEVMRGHLLGCEECYEVFGDILITELLSSNKLPARFLGIKKTVPIHIGRSPGESLSINVSSQLLALNEALNETLGREDYEQAALLRDQIRALTEHQKSENEENKHE